MSSGVAVWVHRTVAAQDPGHERSGELPGGREEARDLTTGRRGRPGIHCARSAMDGGFSGAAPPSVSEHPARP